MRRMGPGKKEATARLVGRLIMEGGSVEEIALITGLRKRSITRYTQLARKIFPDLPSNGERRATAWSHMSSAKRDEISRRMRDSRTPAERLLAWQRWQERRSTES